MLLSSILLKAVVGWLTLVTPSHAAVTSNIYTTEVSTTSDCPDSVANLPDECTYVIIKTVSVIATVCPSNVYPTPATEQVFRELIYTIITVGGQTFREPIYMTTIVGGQTIRDPIYTTITVGWQIPKETTYTTITAAGTGLGTTTVTQSAQDPGQTVTVIVETPTTKYLNVTYSQTVLSTLTTIISPVSTNSSTPIPSTSSTLVLANFFTPIPNASSTLVLTNSSTPIPSASSTLVLTNSSTPIPSTSSTLVLTNSSTPIPSPSSTLVLTNSSTPASSTSSSAPTSSSVPFACSPFGYLIQTSTFGASLYQIDIDTGGVTTVVNRVGSYTSLNAMGYNTLDNFLYAYNLPNGPVIRISPSGSTTVVSNITAPSANVGDIDGNGQYWLSAGGRTWNQVDLSPGSPTYGQILHKGTATIPNSISLADWVYLPGQGEFLYSVGKNPAPASDSSMLRFSLTSHTWQVLFTYPSLQNKSFGAIYGASNGTFWGSDSNSGEIWRFTPGAAPVLQSHGPSSSNNDGARCGLAP